MTTRADSISLQARQVKFVPWLLNLIATLLIAVGWLAYKLGRGAFLTLVWCGLAVADGWRQAREAERVKQRAAAARFARG